METLLDLMACPVCKCNLIKSKIGLECDVCDISFEVKEGVPVLLQP